MKQGFKPLQTLDYGLIASLSPFTIIKVFGYFVENNRQLLEGAYYKKIIYIILYAGRYTLYENLKLTFKKQECRKEMVK